MEEMSKKYFFRDDSYPSMRLFEWEDDNGKTIEEEELWKPLPGDTVDVCTKSLYYFFFGRVCSSIVSMESNFPKKISAEG